MIKLLQNRDIKKVLQFSKNRVINMDSEDDASDEAEEEDVPKEKFENMKRRRSILGDQFYKQEEEKDLKLLVEKESFVD
jgi:hypothetical protein